MKILNQVYQYSKDVLSGKIDSCELVKRTCQRFESDLKRKDLYFDEEKAAKVIAFIQMQEHTKGKWKGKPLILEPWQKFIVANLFGFYKNGRRKYTRAYLEMPKKQGKSPLAAAIGNYMLIADNENAAEVYSAATKLDQAAIVFGYAKSMIEGLEDKLGYGIKTADSFNNRRIIFGDNIFRPIAYDERDKNDGLGPSCAIIDEYHAHPSDRIYSVLADGFAARENPLLLAITTAGHDRESACYKHREFCLGVLNGTLQDDNLFAMVFTIDEGDDWTKESTHKKANPNYGVSVNPEYIKSKLAEAKESGMKRDTFLIKHLNVWTDSYTTWISNADYEKCKSDFEPKENEVCYGGLDLASTGDFTALNFDFEKEGIHRMKSFYYLPETKIRQWGGQLGDQIRQWVRDGWIIQTQGDTTDYDYVEKQIKMFASKYQITSIGYDPANSKQFASKMFADGVNMRPFSQGIMNMNKPTKMLDELIRGGKYEHDGNPVTKWQFSNVNLYRDANDNHKVIKGKDPNKKVDGVVAIIMSVGEAIDEENKKDWFFMPEVI